MIRTVRKEKLEIQKKEMKRIGRQMYWSPNKFPRDELAAPIECTGDCMGRYNIAKTCYPTQDSEESIRGERSFMLFRIKR